jgi:hypothetical protein
LTGQGARSTIRDVKLSPTLLAVLAIPAAIIGYLVGVAITSALPLPDGAREFLLLTIPLFIAALCTVPFLIPFFDRMARRDLEAHRAQQAGSQRIDSADPSAPDADDTAD